MAGAAALPVHKLIPQTGFIVDGFKYKSPAIKAYFLSHAHSDHYTGLRDTWDYGTIYCSEVTGKLVVRIVGVNPELVSTIQWDTPTVIEGVEVTLVDANHCPGAAQILFRLPSGEGYVHCGDMRFGTHLLGNPHLQRFQGCHAVFLDTTYCNPKYTFPPQEEAVEYIAATIHRLLTASDGKRRLFMIQTYVIGKEHILIEVFKRCGRRIFLSERKLGIMQCLDMPGLVTDDIFTTNPDETNIHLTQWGWLGESWPFFRPNFKNMESARTEMKVDEVVGFCPTGWMYEMKRKTYPVKSKGPNSIHLVPYSEHSSYLELREYVRFLKPHKVIPTVNVEGETADKNRRAMLKHFRNLVDETASKASFLAAFRRGGGRRGASVSAASSDASSEPDGAAAAVAADGREPGGNGSPDDEEESALVKEEKIDLEPDAPLPYNDGLGEAANSSERLVDCKVPEPTPHEEAEAAKPKKEASQPELSLRPWADAPAGEPRDIVQPQQAATAPSEASAVLKLEADAALPAVADSAGAGAPPCCDGSSEPEGERQSEGAAASQFDEKQHQLLAVLGEEITGPEAARLLERFAGDTQKALNAFYDRSAGSVPKAQSRAANPQRPQPTPRAKAAKRKPPPKRAPAVTPKRTKVSGDQRQITAFFGQPGGAQPPTPEAPAAPPATPGEVVVLEDDAVDGDGTASSQEQSARLTDATYKDEPEQLPRPKIQLPPAPNPRQRLKSSSPQKGLGAPEIAGGAADCDAGGAAGADSGSAAAARAQGMPDAAVARAAASDAPSRDAVARPARPAAGSRKAQQDRAAEVPPDAVLKGVREYKPAAMAVWEAGQPAPYLHVSRALAAMDGTTKRLRISDVIANMFRSLLALSPEDLLPAAYLVTGKLAPDYEGLEMSVGGSVISAAVIEATGVTRQRLSALYKKHGDLGDVVQACRQNQATLQKPASLTVRGVFKTMQQIAAEKGSGSATRKQRAVLSLLRGAREDEPKYLVRTLISNLRVGANWRSVIPGLARAFILHEKGPGATKGEMDAASVRVSEAFHLCPSLDVLIPALMEGGLAELERRCTLKAGVPLKPMLAKICEGIPDALRQLKGDFIAEFKYDGMRSQIHLLPDGSVKLFSRNCEDRTVAYPDVVDIVQQASAGGARELVMDAELVAVDRTAGNRLRAFQELATRARGHTELHEVSVHVCVFVFDLLMADGEALIKLSLRERRARIPSALPCLRPGFIQLAQSQGYDAPEAAGKTGGEDQADAEESEASSREAQVQSYLLESFASGTEGLMLKALDVNATYQASKRSENWLKLKRDYCEGLRDSLDLVPIGAWYGQGRKTGWFSPFLMAAWDPDKEEYQSVCRCMSGFTDAFYTEATQRLTQQICERKPYYNTGEWPSVWFEPGEVWEIRGADLTISPVHRAAVGRLQANPDRGVSLRFPRYIRSRDDKSVEDASSPEVLVDLYNKQTRKMSSAKELLEAQKRKEEHADDAAAQAKTDEESDRAEEDEHATGASGEEA